jgi:subtilisin family serine protease
VPKNRFAEFNLDPALAEAVESAPHQQLIEGIIRLEDPTQIPAEFRIICQFIRICTGRFLAEDTWTIRQHPNVVSLKAARSLGVSQSGDMLPGGSVVHAPAAPPLRFTGRGSIVAALDFGLDFGHPNFLNPDGSTRVMSFWHQGATYDLAHPNRYGYGRMFSRDEINAALRTSDPYRTLGYHPAISDTGKGSHGTHTLDIAAGNGRAPGSNSGIAPEAEIIFVHLSTPRLGVSGDLGDSVRMLEALDFAHRTAADRPCVVNLSVGREAGSHDATSPFEQAMHELLRMGSGKNRAICQSAGNYGSAHLAVNGWLREGEQRDLRWIVHPYDPGPEIDAWYSGVDRFLVQLLPPDGGDPVEVRLGEVSDINHDGALVGRIYHRKNDPNNRDNHVEVFLYKGCPPGVWIFRLIGEYVITGRFHAWVERGIPGAQSHFDRKITSRSYTLGTIATSPLVITVGAYDANADGLPLASFSSCGPTRDERNDKPEILAPGVRVVAARSIPRGAVRQEGLIMARSGTSMATPCLTGLVAAMFEAAGRPVSITEIRDCLKRSADAAADTDSPNCCAWGRVNMEEAIRRVSELNFVATRQPRTDSRTDFQTGSQPPWFVTTESEDFDPAPGTDGAWGREYRTAFERKGEVDAPQGQGAIMNSDFTGRFPASSSLERTEQAVLDSSAGRQSETLFLQRLMSQLGSEASVFKLSAEFSAAELSPAALFRAAMQGRSPNQLRIVAMRDQKPEGGLRVGDWMLRALPGAGGVGHVCVLASGELVTPFAFAAQGIVAESEQPGYYGVVIESGAFPHTRQQSFARRFLDHRGRVPAHTIILRPSSSIEPEPSEQAFGPPSIPDNVAEALGRKDWPRALALAIQAGRHDENDLTNVVFFARHPELQLGPLDPTNPKFTQLAAEWTAILKGEVRPAIEKASANADLKVSGDFVAERDQQFWGTTGKKFRDLVEWAAGEVDINPGLLGAVLLAEVDTSSTYLSPGEIVTFLSGTDDFFEERAQLKANVPAFSQVHFDATKKTINTNENGRDVTTIPFNSGKDAALATAVYLKNGEIKLRAGAQKNGGDFDKFPIQTQFALTRIAMAAGHGWIAPDGTLIKAKWQVDAHGQGRCVRLAKGDKDGIFCGVASRLKKVLDGNDILIRKNEPRLDPTISAHITDRNATILTAQALHLSDWIFGKPLAAATQPQVIQPKVQESESWSEYQESAYDKFTPASRFPLEQPCHCSSREQNFDLGATGLVPASIAEDDQTERVVHVRVNDLAHPLGSHAILEKVRDTYDKIGITLDVQFGSFVKEDFRGHRDRLQITVLSPHEVMDADDEKAIRDAIVNWRDMDPAPAVAQTMATMHGNVAGYTYPRNVRRPLADIIFVKEIAPKMRSDLMLSFHWMYPTPAEATEALEVYFYADTIIHELGHTLGLSHTSTPGNRMYMPAAGQNQYDPLTDVVGRPGARALLNDTARWGVWVKNELARSERTFTQDQIRTMKATLEGFVPASPKRAHASEGIDEWSESADEPSGKFTPPSWLKIERRTQQRPSDGYFQSEEADGSALMTTSTSPSWLKIEQRTPPQTARLPYESIEEDFIFEPTGEQTDFSPELRKAWHALIETSLHLNIDNEGTGIIGTIASRLPAGVDAAKQIRLFSPASRPFTVNLSPKNIPWHAFPQRITSPSTKDFEDLDKPSLQISEALSARRENLILRQMLRNQDEYCEWQVLKEGGKIKRVIFTCEPPEYCQFLYDPGDASLTDVARALLIKIYQRRCDSTAIKLSDLETHNAKHKLVYNRGNDWNNRFCVHLQQPANTLGAEINIAARASIVRKDTANKIITNISELLECDPFGEPSRGSDPSIGAAVNQFARENRFITLQNPVGLYMTALDTSGWKTPDGTDAQEFFHVINGTADKDSSKSMIVRAEYSVPASKGYTVSDIKIGGIPIAYGGHIAQHLEMRLGALVGPKDMNLDGKPLAAVTPVRC